MDTTNVRQYCAPAADAHGCQCFYRKELGGHAQNHRILIIVPAAIDTASTW